MRAGFSAGDVMLTMKTSIAWMVVDVSSRVDVDRGRWRTSWQVGGKDEEERRKKIERD